MTTPAAPPRPSVVQGGNVAESKPKGRGRPKGTPPKEHPVIPGDEFVIEDIAPDSRGYLRRQRTERSAQQQAVDTRVLDLYKEWVSLGSPTKWHDMNVRGWVISRQFEEEALILLGKAVLHHNKKLVTGEIQRKPLPDLPLPPGKVRIPFAVVARKSQVTGVPGQPDNSGDASGDSKEA